GLSGLWVASSPGCCCGVGGGGPRAELELQLVDDFGALAAVSAARDEEMAALMRSMVKDEPADGPFAELAGRLIALAS
ncbi:hypothetical protein ACFVZ6_18505, partial [Streptomyces sp. NPDC059597]